MTDPALAGYDSQIKCLNDDRAILNREQHRLVLSTVREMLLPFVAAPDNAAPRRAVSAAVTFSVEVSYDESPPYPVYDAHLTFLDAAGSDVDLNLDTDEVSREIVNNLLTSLLANGTAQTWDAIQIDLALPTDSDVVLHLDDGHGVDRNRFADDDDDPFAFHDDDHAAGNDTTGHRHASPVSLTEYLTVNAEVHTDDRAVEITFDATRYFEQASDEALSGLRAINYRGNYSADDVALVTADLPGDPQNLAPLFAYLEAVSGTSRLDVGFEVVVHPSQAEAWLARYRSHLLTA